MSINITIGDQGCLAVGGVLASVHRTGALIPALHKLSMMGYIVKP